VRSCFRKKSLVKDGNAVMKAVAMAREARDNRKRDLIEYAEWDYLHW
jgi:hypothetical protein